MDDASIAAGVVDFTTPGAEFPFARAAPLLVTHGLSGAAVPLASLWERQPPPAAAVAAPAAGAAADASADASADAAADAAAAASPTTTLLIFGRNLL